LFLIREAVDRFLADERIDTGIAVESDKLADAFDCRIHGGGIYGRCLESMRGMKA